MTGPQPQSDAELSVRLFQYRAQKKKKGAHGSQSEEYGDEKLPVRETHTHFIQSPAAARFE